MLVALLATVSVVPFPHEGTQQKLSPAGLKAKPVKEHIAAAAFAAATMLNCCGSAGKDKEDLEEFNWLVKGRDSASGEEGEEEEGGRADGFDNAGDECTRADEAKSQHRKLRVRLPVKALRSAAAGADAFTVKLAPGMAELGSPAV
eukprot:TRINITY_DN8961_c0_g1_i1.p2 TRINITY_DN8961_c0_g1~~TRINITY_DN8961_c0_g1_i1.p2  ORF type:complete len:146 (-),score=43.52 TRINITY_DN8961_c0_g1_i1:433-870(-)